MRPIFSVSCNQTAVCLFRESSRSSLRKRRVGSKTPLAKARAIYNYVIATMRYDKSGTGWGNGDAIWACTAKRGNCTDFHSLFIGMMRGWNS